MQNFKLVIFDHFKLKVDNESSNHIKLQKRNQPNRENNKKNSQHWCFGNHKCPM